MIANIIQVGHQIINFEILIGLNFLIKIRYQLCNLEFSPLIGYKSYDANQMHMFMFYTMLNILLFLIGPNYNKIKYQILNFKIRVKLLSRYGSSIKIF